MYIITTTTTGTSTGIIKIIPNLNPIVTQYEKQDCLVEQCAEQIRKSQGLPPGTPIVTGISCPCPRCSPRC